MKNNCKYVGPFLIYTGNTTIKVNENWAAQLTTNNNVLILKE